MMNKKHGIFSEPGTVRFERLLTGPAERIWDYLTKSELKARWLSAGDVEPKVSGKVIFNFKHSDLTETGDPVPDKYKAMEEGTYFEGRVLISQSFTNLEYTRLEGAGDAPTFTYDLIPHKNNQVLLRLTPRRLSVASAIRISVSAGWHTHLGILADRLSGKKPESFWKVHGEMETVYRSVIIKKDSADHRQQDQG